MGYLTFADVKEKIKEHVKIALNISEFEITFAKRENDATHGNVMTGAEVWKVNIEYMKPDQAIATSALFTINAKNGDVLEFNKDMKWKF